MFSLLKTFFNRSFLSLFFTQYLGAFNDNFFRTAMATFITYKVSDMSASDKSVVVSLAVALFMLPFFLFSAMAGEIADKIRKDLLIKLTKALEVVIVLLPSTPCLIRCAGRDAAISVRSFRSLRSDTTPPVW